MADSIKTTFLKLIKPLRGTRNWSETMNGNFDLLDAELRRQAEKDDTLDTRITNIVADAGSSNIELVDARTSSVTGKTYAVLNERLLEMEKLLNYYNMVKSDMDINGIYRTMTYSRQNGTKYMVSTLNGSTPYYEEMKWEFFDKTGKSEFSMFWRLTYDSLGEIIKRELIV